MKWIRWRSAVVGDLEADGTASFNVELYSSSYERSEESGGGSFETSAHGGPGPLTMPSDLENVTAILRGLLAEAGAPSVLSDTATVTCPMEYRDRYGWSALVPAYTPAVARPWLYRDRYGWSTIVVRELPADLREYAVQAPAARTTAGRPQPRLDDVQGDPRAMRDPSGPADPRCRDRAASRGGTSARAAGRDSEAASRPGLTVGACSRRSMTQWRS